MKLLQLQHSLAFLSLPLLLSPIPGASALPIGGKSPLNALLPSYRLPLLNGLMNSDPMGGISRFLPDWEPEYRAKILRYLKNSLPQPRYMGDRISDDSTLARRGLSDDDHDDGDDSDGNDDEQPSSDDTDGEFEKRGLGEHTHRHEKRQVFHALMNAIFAMQLMPYVQALSTALTWSPMVEADDYMAKWHPDWRHALYKIDTLGRNVPYDQWKKKMTDERIANGMAPGNDEQKEVQEDYAKKFKQFVALHHKLPDPDLFKGMPPYVNLASVIKDGTAMLARQPGGEAILTEVARKAKIAAAKIDEDTRKRRLIAAKQAPAQKKTPLKPKPQPKAEELPAEGQLVAANNPTKPKAQKAAAGEFDMPDPPFNPSTRSRARQP